MQNSTVLLRIPSVKLLNTKMTRRFDLLSQQLPEISFVIEETAVPSGREVKGVGLRQLAF